MNIALIGYGSMGQAIEKIALNRGHKVVAKVDHQHSQASHTELTEEALKGVDMAIDFSRADQVLKHLEICRQHGTNLVVGTTGWYGDLDKAKSLAESGKIGFLWSPNFLIGVNLFLKIVEQASQLINDFDEYDIWGHEIHHYNKADSPSGTAKALGKILLQNIKRKTKMVEEKLDRKREPHEIHFSSVRGGAVNFAHTIGFDAEADTITITHSARNREGHALGAIKAAEWLKDKKGYFEMTDFLHL